MDAIDPLCKSERSMLATSGNLPNLAGGLLTQPDRKIASNHKTTRRIRPASCCCMARCATVLQPVPDARGRAPPARSRRGNARLRPSGLPLPDAPAEHPKVAELRELSAWSEGQVWCSPNAMGR